MNGCTIVFPTVLCYAAMWIEHILHDMVRCHLIVLEHNPEHLLGCHKSLVPTQEFHKHAIGRVCSDSGVG